MAKTDWTVTVFGTVTESLVAGSLDPAKHPTGNMLNVFTPTNTPGVHGIDIENDPSNPTNPVPDGVDRGIIIFFQPLQFSGSAGVELDLKRIDGSNRYFLRYHDMGRTLQFFRVVGGVSTQLVSTNLPLNRATGEVHRIEFLNNGNRFALKISIATGIGAALGSSLALSTIFDFTDAPHNSGNAGFRVRVTTPDPGGASINQRIDEMTIVDAVIT